MIISNKEVLWLLDTDTLYGGWMISEQNDSSYHHSTVIISGRFTLFLSQWYLVM